MKTPGTQTDTGLYFDGVGSGPKAGSSRYAHNQFTGHSNDGRTVQMSQQPNRTGNDGTCGHSGMAQTGARPPTAAMSAVPAQGSVRDSINRGTQVRGSGATKVPTASMTIRGKRGPTRGNSQ